MRVPGSKRRRTSGTQDVGMAQARDMMFRSSQEDSGEEDLAPLAPFSDALQENRRKARRAQAPRTLAAAMPTVNTADMGYGSQGGASPHMNGSGNGTPSSHSERFGAGVSSGSGGFSSSGFSSGGFSSGGFSNGFSAASRGQGAAGKPPRIGSLAQTLQSRQRRLSDTGNGADSVTGGVGVGEVGGGDAGEEFDMSLRSSAYDGPDQDLPMLQERSGARGGGEGASGVGGEHVLSGASASTDTVERELIALQSPLCSLSDPGRRASAAEYDAVEKGAVAHGLLSGSWSGAAEYETPLRNITTAHDAISLHTSKSSMLSTLYRRGDSLKPRDESSLDVPSRNWTLEFQQALSTRGQDRYEKITSLIDAFVDRARSVAILLIDERHLPVERKTHKPLNWGVAGGQKYEVDGIFFKVCSTNVVVIEAQVTCIQFAIDERGIYEDDEFVAKAAGHELRGLNAFVSCSHKLDVFSPLIALIDYGGFRLFASSKLPISRENSTLKYGAIDRTIVHNSDPCLAQKMQRISAILCLSKHKVASPLDSNNYVELHMPRDIEGHLGTDNRYYVIDTARLFPPEAPKYATVDGKRRWCSPLPEDYKYYRPCIVEHLVFQLRPELLRRFVLPLSSDAFSKFGEADHETHNSRVRKATYYLFQSVIPQFARNIAAGKIDFDDHKSLVEAYHRAGINSRHLGLVRCDESLSGDEHCELRRLLLVHCLGRVTKKLLARNLRRVASTEQSLRECAAAFLEALFGRTKGSKLFWREVVKKELLLRFNFCLLPSEMSSDICVRDAIGKGMVSLFDLFQDMTNIKLTFKARRRVEQAFEAGYVEAEAGIPTIEPDDIMSLEPRVKKMSLIPRIEADHVAMMARSARKSGDLAKKRSEQIQMYEQAASLYDKASALYQTAVGSKPDEDVAVRNWANILTDMAVLKANVGDVDQAIAILEEADKKYAVCYELRHHSYKTHSCWGNFLTEYGRIVKDIDPELAASLFNRGLAMLSKAEKMRAERRGIVSSHSGLPEQSLLPPPSPVRAEMALNQSCERTADEQKKSNGVHGSLLYYAHIQEKLGNVEGARKTLSQVRELMEMQANREDSYCIELHNNLACAYMIHGQLEITHGGDKATAREYLKRAREELEGVEAAEPNVGVYNLACVCGLEADVLETDEERTRAIQECHRWLQALVDHHVPLQHRPPAHEIRMDECLESVRSCEWFEPLLSILNP